MPKSHEGIPGNTLSEKYYIDIGYIVNGFGDTSI
jgi:hypothetical protein